MKRDLDVFRKLVFAIEATESHVSTESLKLEGVSQDSVMFHAQLLGDAGLVKVIDEASANFTYPMMMIERLTNAGCDFADTIRDEQQWSVAKSVMDAAKSVTLPVLIHHLQRMTEEGWDHYIGKIAN